MFEPKDVAFLATIGCTAQELFDFVDDSLSYDDTSPSRPSSPLPHIPAGSIS